MKDLTYGVTTRATDFDTRFGEVTEIRIACRTVTVEVVMVALAVKDPAGIVIVAGTEATSGAELVSVTTVSEVQATPRVTVSTALPETPPCTVVGSTEAFAKKFELTFPVACAELMPEVAISVNVVSVATGAVVNGTETLFAPSGIVTVEGAPTAVLDELRPMTKPPAGAATLHETVAVIG